MNKLIDALGNNQNNKKVFKKGSIIAFEEDKCTKIYLIINGNIKISSISPAGNEIIYKNLFNGDLFGQNLIFSNHPFYRGDVNVLEDSEVLEFTKDEFMQLLSSNHKFLNEFLNYQSEDTKKLNQTIKILSIQNVEDKIFYLLKINNMTLKIKSITELSTKLFISREATSRAVNHLIKTNKLELKNGILKAK